ncbi:MULTISPECIES: nucleoside hydrolase [Acidianus]|uniref:Nucleoside hydrolase n=1 Tax=Candidatus Acidianus copahuensis TaxID=1160895 RepID=A0A031LKG7_9CREN|nr:MULTISPECIES: nucleoside hydrolase [Acidianus]EZQ01714.1 nucleoside hydrolase [Candidatus Acidianus copahuensis]NON63496.1 nucleoside hydrolase [Acidianus sp. RZ1]
MKRVAIIDSDTASDDTIAIILASRFFELKGITIVAGNVNYENQVRNALFTVEYFKLNVPVYLGSRRPILGNWRTVEEVHGKNGMGEWNYEEPKLSPSSERAIDAILRLSKEYEDELEILAISPLTNIALAYLIDNELVDRVKKVWIMGGAFTKGNTTELGEFNFWTDPEAAEIVLNAGFDITIVPWEVTEEAGVVDDILWEKISSLKSRSSEFFIKVNKTLREFSKKQGNPGSIHPDSLTVTIAYDKNIALNTVKHEVKVETCSRARGGMLIDWYDQLPRSNKVEIVTKADHNKFRSYLLDTLLQLA